MKSGYLMIGIVVSLFTWGCEKKIDFKLNDESQKLVVEATIENDQPPMVILTRSVSYFSTLDPAVLLQSFVHSADVYVSDGSKTHKLKEKAVPLAPGLNLYYYGIDSSSLATAFLGQLNH